MKRLTFFFSVVVFALFTSFAHAALKFDANVPADLKAQMLQDISFIQSIHNASAASPMHQKVFGDVDGSNYFNWLNKRVFAVGLDGCGSPNAVACVKIFFANKMWMTQNYIKFSHPQISRMMVVYHEARHTESDQGNWSHATCPTPFKDAKGKDMRSIWTGAMLAGEPACDVTPYGSYGSSTIMLKNISKFCANCSEKVKADADLYANDQLGRITDAKSKKAMMADFGMPAR